MTVRIPRAPRSRAGLHLVAAVLAGLAFEALQGGHAMSGAAALGLRLLVYGALLLPVVLSLLSTRRALPVRPDATPQSGAQVDEQFRITLASIGDAVIATDTRGRITLMNPVAERLTGWSLPEATGRPLPEVFRIFQAETGKPAANPVEKVLRTGRVVGLANHTALRARDGTDYQIADSGAPIIDEEGTIRGVVMVFSDVTEDYRLRQALSSSEERMRLAMEAAQEGYWDDDLVTGKSFISPRLVRLAGRDPRTETITREEWSRLMAPEDREKLTGSYQSLVAGIISHDERTYRLNRPDGTYRWIYSRSQAVARDNAGRVTRLAGLIADITARKEAEIALQASEERLRDALTAGNIGVFELQMEAGRMKISPELAKMHGHLELELDFAEAVKVTAPEDREMVNERMEEILQNEDTYALEHRIVHQITGHTHWVSIRGRVFRNDQGHAVRVVGMVLDTTDRHRSEERLCRLNTLLGSIREVNRLITREQDESALIRHATDILVRDRGFACAWICLQDERGEISHFAAAGFEDSDSELRHLLLDGNRPRIIEDSTLEDGVYISHGPSPSRAVGLPHPSLGRMPDTIFTTPLRGAEKTLGHFVAALPQELSQDREELSLFKELGADLAHAIQSIRVEREHAEAMEALLVANREAHAANRAKDEFLAVMSHEIRTPLNPIVGYGTLLLDEISEPAQRSYLQSILSSAQHLTEIIEDILDYSRLSSDCEIRLRPQPVEVVAMVEELLSSFRPTAPHLELSLRNGTEELAPIPPEGRFHTDLHILKRILSNFLSNACKYTREGAVVVELGIPAGAGGGLVVRVRDTGIGIDPGALSQLFKPFFQADSSYSRPYEGIGLGLAICKRLVDLLEGELTVTSVPAEGSCFSISLPLGKADGEVSNPAGIRALSGDRALSGRRILVVEDNTDNAQVMRLLLRHAGAEVIIAPNAEAGLALFRKVAVDLTLMDLAMPGMDGLEATAQLLRQAPTGRPCPIITVSAHATERDRRNSLRAGAVEHLPKPVNPSALIAAIQRHLPE